MSYMTAVALLVFLVIHEGNSAMDQGSRIRCQCITKEKRRIGRLIGLVEVNPPTSHCKDTEIIATLKKDGKKICLDPAAPWIQKVLKKKSGQTP
ncbi:interleukin-8-like isoform 2-T2 [Menidia menidia]|uniref:(Atlantic silverside) hypothetical protein n=1 Tax=Menidia menidia TaxID=238744 RepID=A0A8S4B7M5_9TELE|nr:unnamed protein product [Menidia menidia]CAG5940777.1 unnamed protein product [Menidia menidia]